MSKREERKTAQILKRIKHILREKLTLSQIDIVLFEITNKKRDCSSMVICPTVNIPFVANFLFTCFAFIQHVAFVSYVFPVQFVSLIVCPYGAQGAIYRRINLRSDIENKGN